MRKDNYLLQEAVRRLDSEAEQEQRNKTRIKTWRRNFFHTFNVLPKGK